MVFHGMLLPMYLPTPSKIVVIGAGPLGLEVALYARYLGYAVDVYERGRAAETVWAWAEEKMQTPFVENASPLGLAALAAQDDAFRPPAASAVLTAREWIERYLAPLAASDLIVDGLHERTAVVGIERLETPPAPIDSDELDDDSLPPPTWRVHLRDAAGETSTTEANAIIDASRAGEGSKIDGLSAPHFYRIGARDGGEGATFVQGLDQIRTLFAQLADRAGLDLYTSVRASTGG